MPLVDLRKQATHHSPDELVAHLIAFEPKPYEPRGRILYGLTPEGVMLGHQVEAMLEAEENKKLRGWLEAYLIRARAPQGTRLAPIEEAVATGAPAKVYA